MLGGPGTPGTEYVHRSSCRISPDVFKNESDAGSHLPRVGRVDADGRHGAESPSLIPGRYSPIGGTKVLIQKDPVTEMSACRAGRIHRCKSFFKLRDQVDVA